MRKHNFNLVEVLLAVSVVIVGFVGLMAPVSHSWSNMRQAKEKFYSELTTNNIMNWIRLNTSANYTRVSKGDSPGDIGLFNSFIARPIPLSEGQFKESIYPDPLYGGGREFPKSFRVKRDLSTEFSYQYDSNREDRITTSTPYFHAEFVTDIEGTPVPEFTAVGAMNVGLVITNLNNLGGYLSYYVGEQGPVNIGVRLAWPAEAEPEEQLSLTTSGVLF